MNIKEASYQIRGAIRAYLAKTPFGMYKIPFRMQRPIVMFGPPGVGKTAIIERIAQDFDINFVSYSITHHTRQSALGLPVIVHEEFDGVDYNVSEYTMSEIIASVYHAQDQSGVKQGVLFLDEINCVSETLAPAMLQFLQYKTFGTHKLPEGWIIVTAGNPPEYNRSARDFDPAMMDRLKRIDIEPSLQVWQEYATLQHVHPAIITFLENKPPCFYKVQASAQGHKLVTARGWEDLSRIILAYEDDDIAVDMSLITQYIQDNVIANEFFCYYELFKKYEDDYKVSDILQGKYSAETAKRAWEAPYDERIALVGLITDSLLTITNQPVETEEALLLVRSDISNQKDNLNSGNIIPLKEICENLSTTVLAGRNVIGLVADREMVAAKRKHILKSIIMESSNTDNTSNLFNKIKLSFNTKCTEQHELAVQGVSAIDCAFEFLDSTFGEKSQESLILTTKLSSDQCVLKLVSEYGSESYIKHNKELLLTSRSKEVLERTLTFVQA